MRLVKLSPSVFKNESELQDFFDNGLGNQKPKGLFIFRGRHIAPNGLYPGETVLFSYRNKLRFVAKAETGRKDNVYGKRKKYPYCFVVKLPVRKTCVSLEEVERKLHIQADFQKSLSGQVWTKIADSEQAERVIVNLPSAVSTAQSSNSMPDQSPAKIPVRVKQYFTQYWTNDTWNKNAYLEGQDLNYTAGNLFARSKVCSGDSVYIVTVFAGRLFLLGRLTVDRICSRREWKKFHSKDEV